MAHPDRRGRLARSDNDLRRRPTDGFRTAHRQRFAAMVLRAVAELSPDLRRHLSQAELVVADVPDPDGEDVDLRGEVTLARLHLAGPGPEPARLTVYRRPIEMRALRRTELASEVGRAVRLAVQHALGQPRSEDDD
ncbi:hypothetical protein BH23ACT9_BH23ACT9_27080 [soil metagenome]